MNNMQPTSPTPAGNLKPITTGIITEYPLNWPSTQHGSTHEIAIDEKHIFVSGQLMGQVAKLDYDGNILDYFNMPEGSWPHGMLLDKHNQLWVSLEKNGSVVRLNKITGKIEQEIDVRLHAKGAKHPINVAPHGIGLDADGETIWFTGKRTSTLGKINPNGSVEHFQLEHWVLSLSFYPPGQMVASGAQNYRVTVFYIWQKWPTYRMPNPYFRFCPNRYHPDPLHQDCMWFTEQNGVKLVR